MSAAVVQEITTEEARALTDRIKVGVEAVWHFVAEAYERGAHRALGYSSWDDYCTREFGTSRIRLPREERREVVASLRESGLSIRAIAAATGHDRNTVRGDLRQEGEVHPPATTDQEDNVKLTPVDIDPETGEVVAPKVTGTDGKQYQRQVNPRPKDRRPALTDTAMRAGHEFRKTVERLERIADDDRFPTNREQVALHLRGHLSYATEVCQDLLRRLDHQPQED